MTYISWSSDFALYLCNSQLHIIFWKIIGGGAGQGYGNII